MPPLKHAILSASSSHRCLNCNPSARLEAEFENKETTASAEGTAAHALAEHKLRKALKLRSKKPVSEFDCDEMDEHTRVKVNIVQAHGVPSAVQLSNAVQEQKKNYSLQSMSLSFRRYFQMMK